MTERPPTPLDHFTRRRILRWLHENPGQCLLGEVADGLGLQRNKVSYHGRVLAQWEQIKIPRARVGREQVMFISLVEKDPDVIAVLDSTHREDEREAGTAHDIV